MPQVAVLLESSHETSRAMLQGILQYVRAHGPWSISTVLGGFLRSRHLTSRLT